MRADGMESSGNLAVARAADLATTDAVLRRLCADDEELAAVKRVLGVDAEERLVTDAFTPERPPVPEFAPEIDHLAHAQAAVERYEAWVASFPDDDPTPLDRREYTAMRAVRTLERLEAEGGTKA